MLIFNDYHFIGGQTFDLFLRFIEKREIENLEEEEIKFIVQKDPNYDQREPFYEYYNRKLK